MIKEPKISVVMSVYDGEAYVGKAIESILGQTFKDFEFIIINDGSVDKSSDIIRSYDDDRIVFIDQKNSKLAYSLNKGIHRAKAPLIARMDADDISLPDRLRTQFSWLCKNPGIGVLGLRCKFIDSEGTLTGRVFGLPGEQRSILENILHPHKGAFIIHPTVMMRKEVVLRAGGYNERFPVCEDIDLWLRISSISKLQVISKVQYFYRKHSGNVSSTKRSTQLLSGILARVCYYLRQQGLPDPSLGARENWLEFYDFAKEIVKQRESQDAHFL